MIVHARSEHARGGAAARRLRERARAYLSALGRADSVLSILVVGDAAMRRLNRRWRGKDRPTDVLSFPSAPGPAGEPLLGDVVISVDTARRVAKREGRAVAHELDRYLAHGVLHLLGYDHVRPRDAACMARAEHDLVGSVGLVAAARPPGPARRRPRAQGGPPRSGPR